MNGLKALIGTAALLSLVGCGQGYSPSPDESVPTVQGGGDVFTNGNDGTVYHTASYEVLRYTITNTMNLGTTTPANATTICGTGIALAACPKAAPVQYLDANKNGLGVPVYNQDDPLATQAPSQMTSGGFKTWVLASSSACGRMMTEQATPSLFPNGIHDYTYMYNALLGRDPSASEVGTLENLESMYTAAHGTPQAATVDQVRGAAACSAVLGSLEFLTAN